jgi:hypothetical protein
LKQELFKVATRAADGGAVREDDAEPQALDDDNTALRGGEVVAVAVKGGSDPLHTEVERALGDHTDTVRCLVVHGDVLISGSGDHTIKVWDTDTWKCEHTLECHGSWVTAMVMHGDMLISGSRDCTANQSVEHRHMGIDTSTPSKARLVLCDLHGGAWRQANRRL